MIEEKAKTKIKTPFLQKCFNKKTLITKAIVFAIALVIVLIPSLTMYLWCLKQTSQTPWGIRAFIYINIIDNPGIGFGGLSGNVAGIYALQTFIILILIAVYLFLCNDKITMSFAALAICGGAFNLFQRMAPWTFLGKTYYNCVLDYIKFGNWFAGGNFPTFNFPDSFVVVGSIGFAISFIVVTIVKSVRESKAEKEIKTPDVTLTKPEDKPIVDQSVEHEWKGKGNE